ncbi:MAG TPA: hypothetical protein VLV55_11935 [Rhizomicrobium sp.]|nr:hypothetical protein [Rhizomicrobium sp.]
MTHLKAMICGTAFLAACGGGVLIGQALASQPHMDSALDFLQKARAELVLASADKGGHRVAAINDIDKAIAETRAGIRYSNNH